MKRGGPKNLKFNVGAITRKTGVAAICDHLAQESQGEMVWVADIFLWGQHPLDGAIWLEDQQSLNQKRLSSGEFSFWRLLLVPVEHISLRSGVMVSGN